ncbi:CGG triplet repeat-binding protein 1-like [Galendromus occidentalis]|uniref:CGG triplet repeat-binding protein 1-like n=1 Tax=Galendromus occidentalis TaxID=34638 RepID=A0AAJ6VZL9_9ACAR|nr:CGG triplet repeat-binding protein 1-like [Galendromus occidentalis]
MIDSSEPLKTSTLITAEKRAKQLERGTFHATEDVLFCSSCNVPVEGSRKHSCSKHFQSTAHKRKVECPKSVDSKKVKLQVALTESFGRVSDEQLERQSTLVSLVEAFASANIPLHTVENAVLRRFPQCNIEMIGSLPSANKQRQNYLPKAHRAHEESIRSFLDGRKSFATDAEGRYILNVLAIPCCKEGEVTLTAVLLECEILECTNFKTVSEAVL